MLHDPVASRIWSQEEISHGGVERATAEEIFAFFMRLLVPKARPKLIDRCIKELFTALLPAGMANSLFFSWSR